MGNGASFGSVLTKLGLRAAPESEEEEDETAARYAELQHVDTGDSLKVKQVLDETVVKALLDADYEEDHNVDNLKIGLMVVACLFAMTAQFYPAPFPNSRPLLGICCSGYFIFSGILQLAVKYLERDAILITKPKRERGETDEGKATIKASTTGANSAMATTKAGVRVSSFFPRFQSEYTIKLQYDGDRDLGFFVEESYCVGRFFDADGYFWEDGFAKVVDDLLERFEQGEMKKDK